MNYLHLLVQRADRRIGRRTLYFLLFVATCVYFVAYLNNPNLPSKTSLGWWGFWDQGKYLKSAQALAQFDFRTSSHWYPLGYPLIGALFVRILPVHPFLIPNLLFFLGILSLLYHIFRSLLSRVESLLLVGFILAQPLVVDHLIIPWTTIPTQLGTYAVIALLIIKRPTQRDFLLAGLVTSLIVLFRPGDILFLAPLFVTSALAQRDWKETLRNGVVVVAVISGGMAVLMLSNKLVFGRFWFTPYVNVVGSIGFGIEGLALETMGLLIDPYPLYGIKTPVLLSLYPWLLFSLPGFLVIVKHFGVRSLGIPISLVLTFFFYLAYRDFDAATSFKYSTVHYLLWMLPLAAFASYLTIRGLAIRGGRDTMRLGWHIPLLLFPAIIAGVVETKISPVATKARLHFNDSVVGIDRLLDNDRGTFLEARFPRKDTVILRAEFPSPQRLGVIKLFGWPNNDFTGPALSVDGRLLHINAEYRVALGPEGLALVFYKERDVKRLEVRADPRFRGVIRISELRFGRASLALGGVLARWLTPKPGVRAWRIGAVADVAGPWSTCDVPDGVADQAIAFEIDRQVGRRLRTIELETSWKGGGKWVSCGGARSYWLAALRQEGGRKAATVASLADGGRFRVQVKDNGAFAGQADFVLVGKDQSAHELFRVPVEGLISSSKGERRSKVDKPLLSKLPPPYLPGREILYDAEDVFYHFYKVEKGFRWTHGDWAALRINLKETWSREKRATLILKTRFSNGPQTVVVTINHNSLGVLHLGAGGGRFPLTFDSVHLRRGANLFTLHTPEATRPPNGDPRVLGLALESFTLKPEESR